VTPPEDGLSISRNICRGFLSNILKNILVFFKQISEFGWCKTVLTFSAVLDIYEKLLSLYDLGCRRLCHILGPRVKHNTKFQCRALQGCKNCSNKVFHVGYIHIKHVFVIHCSHSALCNQCLYNVLVRKHFWCRIGPEKAVRMLKFALR
jgi:hypothetical protein